MNWHSLEINEILHKLHTNKDSGISSTEAKKRALKYGENVIIETKPKSFLNKLLSQFSDFMVIALIVAAIISAFVAVISKDSDYVDSVLIISIVVINAFIGVFQENKAEKEIASLKELSTPLCKVVRDGLKKRIASKCVVPGDIICPDTGDLICADARLIDSANLAVEESAMTGESFSVEKSHNLALDSKTAATERGNMIFAGSVVTRGHARAVVTATGMNTEIGKIASMINCEKSSQTPLQKRLSSTGKLLGICIMIVSLAVFLLGVIQNVNIMEMLMISISLAVAAIPEGLPAVVTIVLASGVRKMAKHNAIVRKLPAIEALGHAGIICCDKTGTLTVNKMKVFCVRTAEGEANSNDVLKDIFKLTTLCNNSTFSKIGGKIVPQGEPTENALLVEASNLGIFKKDLNKKFKRTFEIPFDSKRKLMTVVCKNGKGSSNIVTKGAPDVLLNRCKYYLDSDSKVKDLSSNVRLKILQKLSAMTSDALRVIAVAYKNCSRDDIDYSDLEKKLIFVGLIGLIDPPRKEVVAAVKRCKDAGVRPVIITGDHANTALEIAKKVGIASDKDFAVTGDKISNMSSKELAQTAKSCSVFARVSPEHKVKIVKAFQLNGEVVVMIGDGVNDAPALKAADIGCAMGKSGTDAAKNASDIILADDNFSTIVEAVKQGRGIYQNIKKTIHFLLSTNISEVMAVLFGFLIKVPPPLLAIHLLWINLVTDAFPALALGVDPIEKNIMKNPPESSKNSFFSGGLGYNIVVEGMFIAAVGLLSYSIGRAFFDLDPLAPIVGRTMAFLTLGISQIIHTFNVRSKKSLKFSKITDNMQLVYAVFTCIFLQLIVVTVPVLNSFFKTVPLGLAQWIIVLVLSATPVVVSEIEKRFFIKH